jgi:hypothetical protein
MRVLGQSRSITIHDAFKKGVVLVREQCKSYGCDCTTLLPSVMYASYFAYVGVTVLSRRTELATSCGVAIK